VINEAAARMMERIQPTNTAFAFGRDAFQLPGHKDGDGVEPVPTRFDGFNARLSE